MLDEQARTLTNNPPRNSSPSQQNHRLQGVLPSDFALVGMLESMSAMAYEIHDQTTLQNPWNPTSISTSTLPPTSTSLPPSSSTPPTTKYHTLLTTWYTTYQPTHHSKPSWPSLMMLWHSIHITLHADINALECAAGREGYESVQKYTPYARAWVRSADAKRCLLHALLIQKNFESLSAGAEPAMFVPKCLYYCGLVWACFMCFGGDNRHNDESCEAENQPERDDEDKPGHTESESQREDGCITIGPAENLQFAELRLPGVDGIGVFLEQMGGLQPRRLAVGSLFRIIDLLQRISHWKIAQSLAMTLLVIVEETQDLF